MRVARVQCNLLDRKDFKMFESPVLSVFARVTCSLKHLEQLEHLADTQKLTRLLKGLHLA